MPLPALTEITVCGPNDPSVFGWPITSRMGDDTCYRADGTAIIAHSKSGLWPTEAIADDGTLTEGNWWGLCEVEGKWYARTLHHIRPGQTTKQYPPAEWGDDRVPLPIPRTHVLHAGDLIGVFVSTRARYGTNPARERSGIVWLRIDGGIVAREGVDGGPVPPDVPEPDPPPPPHDDTGDLILAQIIAVRQDMDDALTAIKGEMKALREEVARGVKVRFR